MKSRTQKIGNGKGTADFLNIAYNDYLAARVLINNELLVQGAVLASTAIEKYFKAILAFRGNESIGHLKKAHFNAVKNFSPELWADLNEEFIQLLQRAYCLRYQDKLEKNFNLVIASREFLAELDFTALKIQNSFHITKEEKDAVLAYQQGINNMDSRIYYNNYLLTGIDKQSFIAAEDQVVYEIRKCPIKGLIETTYIASAGASDGKFMRTAFTPLSVDGTKYQASFKDNYLESLFCSVNGVVLERVRL